MEKKNTFQRLFIFLALLIIILPACKPNMEEEETTSGDFWKNQATNQILDQWLAKGIKEESGIFYTFMNREWGPYRGNVKYPGMVARHIFSYSSGYMLTGEQKYLDKASELMEFVINKGWDKKYGGWYEAIEESGGIIDDSKDLFNQIYAASGLTMYYFVTHDTTALKYIEETHKIIEDNAWDKEYGGYFRTLNRDLSAGNTNKPVTPQIATISGYLLYMYLATMDKDYLDQSEKLINLILDKMINEDYQYVQENYDRSWNYNYEEKGADTEINIGHNLETLWILLRLYDLTGKDQYLQVVNNQWEKLKKYGYEERNMAWYHRIGLEVPSLHTDATPWWIQAYGNMMTLYYYHISGKEKHLQLFDKGAKYWNNHFIDKEYGGTVLSVNNNGKIQKGQKAVRTKTSYHSTEHGLLNYMYTNLWVKKEPVMLYFNINNAEKNEKIYPIPVEDKAIKIISVQLNGNNWDKYDSVDRSVTLPAEKNIKLKVTLHAETK